MWKTLTVFVLLGIVVAAAADEPKDKKPNDSEHASAKSLKPGDQAPALNVSKWLQGGEVKHFAPDKIYVVEFWATWCGPCIMMMPHLAEMQAEYKDKGVTFIGFTSKDPNNGLKKVTEFVQRRGPKLGYTFAYADDGKTYANWMTAARQNGIPCSFVVDGHGKIAYIGHPMYLGEVLPKILAGTWKASEGEAEVAKMEADVNGVFEKISGPTVEPEAGLKAIAEFSAKRPGLASIPYFVAPRLQMLLRAKKVEEAKKLAEETVSRAVASDDTMMLRMVLATLMSSQAKEAKGMPEFSIKAADALVELAGGQDASALASAGQVYLGGGQKAKALKCADAIVKLAADKDAFALVSAGQLYLNAGDKAKARDCGKKALSAAKDESPRLKRYVTEQAKKLGAEPDAEK